MARRSTKSVLRQRDYEGLSSLDFTEITEEMKLLCPTAFNILPAMIQFVNNEDKRTAPMALIYSIMMFKRCHEMSRVQRVNTVLLAEGNASQEVSNNYEPLDLTAVFKTRRSFYRYLPLFSFINHSPNAKSSHCDIILMILIRLLLLLSEAYICWCYYFEVFEYNSIVVYMLSSDTNHHALLLFYKGV